MGRSRIRLRDIAEKTGFSANTVSLALRDSPRIPQKTREQIQRVAKELNYRPNRIAQSLVSQRTMTVGLVLTNIRNPILTQVAQEVAIRLADHGYATMFAASGNDLEKELLAIETLRDRQVDGILVYPTDHRETAHLRELREQGFPVVSLAMDPAAQLDTVGVDEQKGGYLATTHLVGMGFENIALLDAASPNGNTEKKQGYKQALKDAGRKVDPDSIAQVNGHGIQFGMDVMQELWLSGARPDAVLCTNDTIAVGVELWCEKKQLRIPDDVAIVGFDNIDLARLSAVPITTVAYPVEQISETAVAKLVALIQASGPMPEPEEITFIPELLVRESSRVK